MDARKGRKLKMASSKNEVNVSCENWKATNEAQRKQTAHGQNICEKCALLFYTDMNLSESYINLKQWW